jgi:DNA-binding protein YbaB
MSSPFEDAVGDMLANLDRKREELARFYQSMDEMTSTVRSRRRQVSVTVDARGEILDLKFHGQTYKNLEPGDLSKLILDTIREARGEAKAQMWASMEEVDPQTAEFAQAAEGIDWTQQLQESLKLPQQLLDLLEAPAEDLMTSEEFSELMRMLNAGSNATAESRVEGGDTTSPGGGASDDRGAERPPDQ